MINQNSLNKTTKVEEKDNTYISKLFQTGNNIQQPGNYLINTAYKTNLFSNAIFINTSGEVKLMFQNEAFYNNSFFFNQGFTRNISSVRLIVSMVKDMQNIHIYSYAYEPIYIEIIRDKSFSSNYDKDVSNNYIAGLIGSSTWAIKNINELLEFYNNQKLKLKKPINYINRKLMIEDEEDNSLLGNQRAASENAQAGRLSARSDNTPNEYVTENTDNPNNDIQPQNRASINLNLMESINRIVSDRYSNLVPAEEQARILQNFHYINSRIILQLREENTDEHEINNINEDLINLAEHINHLTPGSIDIPMNNNALITLAFRAREEVQMAIPIDDNTFESLRSEGHIHAQLIELGDTAHAHAILDGDHILNNVHNFNPQNTEIAQNFLNHARNIGASLPSAIQQGADGNYYDGNGQPVNRPVTRNYNGISDNHDSRNFREYPVPENTNCLKDLLITAILLIVCYIIQITGNEDHNKDKRSLSVEPDYEPSNSFSLSKDKLQKLNTIFKKAIEQIDLSKFSIDILQSETIEALHNFKKDAQELISYYNHELEHEKTDIQAKIEKLFISLNIIEKNSAVIRQANFINTEQVATIHSVKEYELTPNQKILYHQFIEEYNEPVEGDKNDNTIDIASYSQYTELMFGGLATTIGLVASFALYSYYYHGSQGGLYSKVGDLEISDIA